ARTVRRCAPPAFPAPRPARGAFSAAINGGGGGPADEEAAVSGFQSFPQIFCLCFPHLLQTAPRRGGRVVALRNVCRATGHRRRISAPSHPRGTSRTICCAEASGMRAIIGRLEDS